MNHLGLPQGYSQKLTIDLQKDRKLMIKINVLALIIMAIMVPLGFALRPASDGTTVSQPLLILVTLIGYIAYILAHEWVHGICIRHFCGEKAEYGFTGMYAYAGKKNAYFDKRSYIIVALAPVVLWGVVLLILNITLPSPWFWPVYIIQIGNLSGAAGDYYVTAIMRKLPSDTLCNDIGVSMSFYEKKEASL